MSRSRSFEAEPLLRVLSPVPDEDDDASSFGSTQSHSACVGEDRHRPAGTTTTILATLLSFLVLGLIVSTPGVVLPHLELHYGLDDAHASLVFLVAPPGYLVGARLSEPIHRRLGRRGIAVLAPLCQAVFAAAVATWHDARRGGFGVFLAATAVGNVGSGLMDGSWCAWAGGLGGRRTNTVQGLLHGSFSVGAGLGPLISGTMFSVAKAPWWDWYYLLLAIVAVQGVVLALAFRIEDARRYREGLEASELEREAIMTTTTTTVPGCDARERSSSSSSSSIFGHKVTWICAAFFLAYVGTEGAIAGWIVTFMLRARHASPYLASLSSSGFWIGQAAGRFALGAATDRIGTRRATSAYLGLAMAAQVVLAAVDAAAVSAAAAAVVGFFLGPLFPSGVVMVAALLPKALHVGAVSFAASVGQLGAALLPFALGALAQWAGIRVFQVFVLAMLVVTLLVWTMFPRLVPRRADGGGVGAS